MREPLTDLTFQIIHIAPVSKTVSAKLRTLVIMSSVLPDQSRLTTLSPLQLRAEQDIKALRPTTSASSASSSLSSSKSEAEDQFVFSPHHTPAHESSSFFPLGPASLASAAIGSSQPSFGESSNAFLYDLIHGSCGAVLLLLFFAVLKFPGSCVGWTLINYVMHGRLV